MDRQRLVLLVGLPGSGKTTWLARQGLTGLSSDDVRTWLLDNPADQTRNRIVFATLRHLVERRLACGRPITYIDATNLTRWERRSYIRLGQLRNCDVAAVFFDVPLLECLRRNALRTRVVPSDAIREMARRMVAPAVEEGFVSVTVIPVSS